MNTAITAEHSSKITTEKATTVSGAPSMPRPSRLRAAGVSGRERRKDSRTVILRHRARPGSSGRNPMWMRPAMIRQANPPRKATYWIWIPATAGKESEKGMP